MRACEADRRTKLQSDDDRDIQIYVKINRPPGGSLAAPVVEYTALAPAVIAAPTPMAVFIATAPAVFAATEED